MEWGVIGRTLRGVAKMEPSISEVPSYVWGGSFSLVRLERQADAKLGPPFGEAVQLAHYQAGAMCT